MEAKPEKHRPTSCPVCRSTDIVPIVHGLPSTEEHRAIAEGRAVAADREEWEGMTEWYCKSCGCDWSGEWRRFKRPPAL
ncbi:MAG TPA: hypothetical protein VIB79_08030 [Candidatus Binatia bacterium]